MCDLGSFISFGKNAAIILLNIASVIFSLCLHSQGFQYVDLFSRFYMSLLSYLFFSNYFTLPFF